MSRGMGRLRWRSTRPTPGNSIPSGSTVQARRSPIVQSNPSSSLAGGDQVIGVDGFGHYEQSGGSNTISAYQGFDDQNLVLGLNPGSQGTYVMSGGTLSISSHRFDGGLRIGQRGQGTVDLSGGTLQVNGGISIGNGGTGALNQTGGSITVGSPAAGFGFMLGRVAGASGTYHLSNANGPASLVIHGNIILGFEGNGTFVQENSDVTLLSPNGNAGIVFVSQSPTATGHYTIGGGTLTATGVILGGDTQHADGGSGTLTVNGGTVNGGLVVWDNGTVVLNGGTINTCGAPPCGPDPSDNVINNGVINNNGGTLNVGGRIYSTNGTAQAPSRGIAGSGFAGKAGDGTGETLVGSALVNQDRRPLDLRRPQQCPIDNGPDRWRRCHLRRDLAGWRLEPRRHRKRHARHPRRHDRRERPRDAWCVEAQ